MLSLLTFQYYGHDVYPPAPAPSNGPTSASAASTNSTSAASAQSTSSSSQSMLPNSYDSLVTTYAGTSEPQPPRPVIKMPKAVASVTSVPTRADYQQQLEANLERKRKRLGDLGLTSGSMTSSDKGKKKGRRGAKNSEEDSEYKPKIGGTDIAGNRDAKSLAESEKTRKTRGKPPKKCLADSPEHNDPDDLKAESMKFAEEIRAQFDESSKSSGSSNRGRKKKRKGGPEPELNNSKTPRLVIKFSKGSTSGSTSGSVASSAAASASAKENGGRDEYDFDDAPAGQQPTPRGITPPTKLPTFVDGTMDTMSSVNNSPAASNSDNPQLQTQPTVKVAKLKIKI